MDGILEICKNTLFATLPTCGNNLRYSLSDSRSCSSLPFHWTSSDSILLFKYQICSRVEEFNCLLDAYYYHFQPHVAAFLCKWLVSHQRPVGTRRLNSAMTGGSSLNSALPYLQTSWVFSSHAHVCSKGPFFFVSNNQWITSTNCSQFHAVITYTETCILTSACLASMRRYVGTRLQDRTFRYFQYIFFLHFLALIHYVWRSNPFLPSDLTRQLFTSTYSTTVVLILEQQTTYNRFMQALWG